MYTIKDNLRGFMVPYNAINDEVAKRDFINSCQTVETMKPIKNDLDLYYLGEYEDETAEFTPNMELLIKGNSVQEV